ncbi:MAG: GMC family oxidoreductase N-terminal domain-containing protein [Myxococcota bacterium]
MIHAADGPLTLRADLCVIGSGAGGSTAATVAAEAGLSVVVLEPGELLTPGDMCQREEVMFPRLFWDNGARTSADRLVKIHQGRGVGGSTLHNLNLCKRIPDPIRARWDLPIDWDPLYAEVEAMLSVSEVSPEQVNRHNALLRDAVAALGWRGGPLRHNRTGCVGSGFCEVGCAFDAKNNAAKVLLPRLVRAGGEVIARCQAVRVTHARGRVTGVDAVALDAVTRLPVGEVRVEAARVCVSASATGTAAVLHRSGLGEGVGDTLRIHPAIVVAGDFDEPVRAWQGVPQSWECTEHLRLEEPDGPRVWIVPAFAHPVATALLVPGLGDDHARWMRRYAHLGALTAMIHDHTAGRVRPRGDLGLRIDYALADADLRELGRGAEASAKLLFAAGARRVMLPDRRVVTRPEDVGEVVVRPGEADLTAVHPMGTVPMGGPVDARGRHGEVDGLWVADASLFPTSIGGPPQLTTYALGLHVGRALAS